MRTVELVLLPGELSAETVHKGQELRVWRDADGTIHVTKGLSQSDPLLVFAQVVGKYIHCSAVKCNCGGGEIEYAINVLTRASRDIDGLYVFRMPQAVYDYRLKHGDEDTNWFRTHCGVSWFRGVEDHGPACATDGDGSDDNDEDVQELHEFMPKEREVYESVTSDALYKSFEKRTSKCCGEELADELMSAYRHLLVKACKRPRATAAAVAAAVDTAGVAAAAME